MAAPHASPSPTPRRLPAWVSSLRAFERPSGVRLAWQFANTLVPYLALLALMAWTVERGLSYWVTLALAVPTGGLMVRLFILFHDAIHGSLVHSPRLRRFLGRVLGVLVFTPYEHWGQSHRAHHATSGDLDRRGYGDVPLLTVEEYLALPKGRQRLARLLRHPLVMFGFGPIWVFLIAQRIPPRRQTRKRVMSVIWTDLALLGVVVAASLAVGFGTYVKVQIPVLWIGGMGGVWLFFVQHHFVPSYWARADAWSPLDAALRGSSYYRLPKVLQWFSGNIGLHHVHHLRPRIPNYRLQACHDATPQLQDVEPLTLRGSLRSLRAHLWHEDGQRFVTFRDAAALARRPGIGPQPPARVPPRRASPSSASDGPVVRSQGFP